MRHDSGLVRHNANVMAMFCPLVMKTYRPGDFRKQSVITTYTDIDAGMKFRTALPNDDIAGPHLLATIALDTEAFGF